MLDEFKEYDEYTCNISDENAVVRFDTRTFLKKNNSRDVLPGMSGLRRALTIIARKELQERGFFSESSNEKKDIIIEEVKEVLIKWTGFSENIDESWLESYYISISGAENINWNELKNRQIRFVYKKVLSDSESNDILMATFERIIADAVYFGSLKRYYLVCRKGSDQLLNNNGKTMDPSKDKDSVIIDIIFKLIGFYLIQKKYTGNKFNYYNSSEFGHWTKNFEITKNNYFGPKEKRKFRYNDQPVFISQDTLTGNITKICICPEYMEKCDFSIVEEGDFKGVSEGYTFYSDSGSGNADSKYAEKLAKEKIYEKC